MDPVGVSLAIASVALFAVTLGLSTRPAQAVHSDKKSVNPSGYLNNPIEQKIIVVKLPQGGDIPEDYTLDLKVSLSKVKKEGEEEKAKNTGRQGKKLYRRLDEYL